MRSRKLDLVDRFTPCPIYDHLFVAFNNTKAINRVNSKLMVAARNCTNVSLAQSKRASTLPFHNR